MAVTKGPSKADLEELIDATYEKLQEAFDPRLSREEMADKLGDIIDDLAPDDDSDDDSEEDDSEDEA